MMTLFHLSNLFKFESDTCNRKNVRKHACNTTPLSFPLQRAGVSIPLCSYHWFVPSSGNRQGPCHPRRAALGTHPAALCGDQEIPGDFEIWMSCSGPRVLQCKQRSILSTWEHINTLLKHRILCLLHTCEALNWIIQRRLEISSIHVDFVLCLPVLWCKQCDDTQILSTGQFLVTT